MGGWLVIQHRYLPDIEPPRAYTSPTREKKTTCLAAIKKHTQKNIVIRIEDDNITHPQPQPFPYRCSAPCLTVSHSIVGHG